MTPQRAYRMVRTALKQGVLVRPADCQRCGRPDKPGSDGRSTIQAHHADYSCPLEVEWICSPCHRRETPLPAKMGGVALGERNGQAKLTAERIALIRTSPRSGADLAREFGVDKSTVNKARRGIYWLAASPDAGGA